MQKVAKNRVRRYTKQKGTTQKGKQIAGKQVKKVCNKSSKKLGLEVKQGTRQEIMEKIAWN